MTSSPLRRRCARPRRPCSARSSGSPRPSPARSATPSTASATSASGQDEADRLTQARTQRLRGRLRTSALDRSRAAELDDLLHARRRRALQDRAGAGHRDRRRRRRFSWTVTIDAGSRDGIRPDMTVLNGDGLVGRVKTVGPIDRDGAARHRPGVLGRRAARGHRWRSASPPARAPRRGDLDLAAARRPVDGRARRPAGDLRLAGRHARTCPGSRSARSSSVRGTPGSQTRTAVVRAVRRLHLARPGRRRRRAAAQRPARRRAAAAAGRRPRRRPSRSPSPRRPKPRRLTCRPRGCVLAVAAARRRARAAGDPAVPAAAARGDPRPGAARRRRAALAHGPGFGLVVRLRAGLAADLVPPADHEVGRWALVLTPRRLPRRRWPRDETRRSAFVPLVVVAVAGGGARPAVRRARRADRRPARHLARGARARCRPRFSTTWC